MVKTADRLVKKSAKGADVCELPVVEWREFRYKFVAGTDEVGRGCLAGPVYAAAVILDPNHEWKELTDSKLIEHAERCEIAERIKRDAIAWSIGVATVEEIEQINILHASLLAMRRAVEGLNEKPGLVLIDGNQKMGGEWRQKTFVKGDLRCQPISAASIIAKVARDAYMAELDFKYPGYGFAANKGYGTPYHQEAIKTLGVTPFHRRAFGGVREYITVGAPAPAGSPISPSAPVAK